MNHTTSEVLDLAADLIQQRGWVQGPDGWNFFIEGQGLCLEGALAAVSGVRVREPVYTMDRQWIANSDIWACPAYQAVASFLELPTRPSGEARLYKVNDTAQSVDEVIAVLRAAAAVERVKESAEQTVAA